MDGQHGSRPIDVSETAYVELDGLSEALHDARLDLSTARTVDGNFEITGLLERSVHGRFGRYPVRLTIAETSDFLVADEAGIALLIVEDVRVPREHVIEFIGAIPANLRVTSSANRASVKVADRPTQVRRFWRWHDARPESPR